MLTCLHAITFEIEIILRKIVQILKEPFLKQQTMNFSVCEEFKHERYSQITTRRGT